MKKIYLLLTILGLTSTLFAQVTDMGGPFAWKNRLANKKTPPVEIMPGYDQAAIDAEDAINDQNKDQVWRFGYKYPTNFSLQNSGQWTTLPNGDRLWQLGISCPGALTVNLLIENFDLPDGAYLYLYDVDQTNRVGAYTSRNNRTDGLLGTELVHGDEIIVEYYEPASVAGQGTITISDVVHGYRSLNIIQNQLWEKALNSSGDCNIDVNCPLGIGWEDQIRSVAMIVVGGSGVCTGALINNTCNDGTPYFLTANHCLGAGGGVGNWAFRFNWETPAANVSCATTAPSTDPGPPYDQTANGATTLANGTVSDFALLQINNMTLNDAQNWNCFYAGWDNSDAQTVTQGTGIHHPSGDVKKICREDNNPYHATAGSPTAQVWMIDDWDQGVTEPGSSGSPLFDQNGRIIGQLYGGAAACNGTNDNNQLDYYGRFGVSWVNGVSTYLAPGACGLATTDDGWDPNAPTLADDAGIQTIVNPAGNTDYCNGSPFTPEVTLKNYGTNNLTSVNIIYNLDAGPNSTYNWTGTLAPGASVNVTLNSFTAADGPHTFNAWTDLPNGTTDSNSGNDASSSNFTQATGTPTTLTINTDCWGYEIYWELLDSNATTVLSGGNTSGIPPGGLQNATSGDPGAYGNQITVTDNWCLTAGCYDFIIYDDWGDGLDGTSSGCPIDGSWNIVDDSTGTVLAAMGVPDYGASDTSNFCVVSPCSGTLSSSTVEESCFGDNDGSLTVSVSGGTSPYTYDIGSGPQGSGTFTNLAQGSYTVTVIDGNSCTNSINVTLGGPAELLVNSIGTDETCPGVADGQINVTATGGTGTLMYDIGSGQQASSSFANLTPNTYNVTVTDANGCTATNSGVIIGTGSGVSATMNVTDVSCNGMSDGQIQVVPTNGSAPYTYDIGSGAQGSDTFTALTPGNYTVTIVDNNGCSGTVNGSVNEPAAITDAYTSQDEIFGNDGSIDLTISGGTPPYSYSWSGPNSFSSTTEDPSGLVSGTYSCTVTDANGCTHSVTGVEVGSQLSIGDLNINFSVYPNPSKGIFNVQLMNVDGDVTVNIVDVTGRLIYTEKINGKTLFTIDISDKAEGTYFIRLTDGEVQTTKPIVNQK